MKKEKKVYPLLLWENHEEKNNRKNQVSSLQQKIEKISSEWQSMKIGPIPNGIVGLLKNPKETHQAALRREIANELPQGTRFKYDIDELLKTYVTPSPEKLINLVSQLTPDQKEKGGQFFRLENESVKQTEAVNKWISEKDLFAQNPQDEEIWADLCLIAEKLNKFNRMAGLLKLPAHVNLGRFLAFDPVSGKYSPDERGFKIVKATGDLFN